MVAEQYPLTDAERAEAEARNTSPPPTEDELRTMGFSAFNIELIKGHPPAHRAEVASRLYQPSPKPSPPTDDELRGMGYDALDIEAIKAHSPMFKRARKPPPPSPPRLPKRPFIRLPAPEPAGGVRRVVDVVIAVSPLLLWPLVLWLVVQVAT